MEYHVEPSYRVSFMFRRILVPVDGSENSLRALEVALDFAKRYGSRIVALHVVDGSIDPDKLKERVLAMASKLGVSIEFKTRSFSSTISSVANEIIQEVLEGGYDLVVMGARGNTVNEELLIGSKVLTVVANVPVSIMVVR